jgi:hypothetical protein
MAELKRYLNWCQPTHGHEMTEDSEGPWVAYEDYERLRADCARFITANAEVGALNVEQAETIARLRAALERAEEGLQCGGHRDRDHYCPNCDNSLWPVRKGLQDARDGAVVETTKSLGPPDCICPKCGAYIMNPWDEPRVADKTEGGT